MAEQNLDNVTETTEDELKKKQKTEQNKAVEQSKEQIKKELEKEAKKLARKGLSKIKDALLESVGASTFGIVAGIILIVLMLIGIISFIVSMPGVVQQKIFNFVDDAVTGTIAFFDGATTENTIPLSEIKTSTVEALAYLEQMGYDAVGFGFAAAVNRNEEGLITNYSDNLLYEGFYTNNVGTGVPQCLMAKYVLANEETYLPSRYHVKNDVGTVFSSFEDEDSGMLIVQTSNDDLFDELIIDRANRTLKGESLNTILGSIYTQSFSYDLESWIGRYGKSLEFLIALQIATMSSGIGEELIDSPDLETKAYIEAEQVECDLDFKIESKNENGEYVQVPITFGNDENALVSKIDIMVVEDEETGEYVYDYVADESLTKEDITIASLNKLITQGKITYAPGSENTYENINIRMAEAIGVFLSDKEEDKQKDLYIQYSFHANSTGHFEEQNLPYLGMYDNTTGEYLGGCIDQNGLYLVGTKQIDTTVGSNQFTKIKNLNSYGTSINTALQQYVNYCNGDTSEQNAEGKAVIDAITLFMYQSDMFFIEKESFQIAKENGVRIDECHMYEEHTITCKEENDSIIVQAEGNSKVYEIDFSPYYAYYYNQNYQPDEILISGLQDDISSDLKQTCFFIKWLDIIEYAKSGDYDAVNQHMKLLKTGMDKAYSVVQNNDLNMQVLVDKLWEEYVIAEPETGDETDPSLENAKGEVQKVAPLSVNAITGMYQAYNSQNVGTAQMYYPTLKYVVNHWYKDLDFTNSYASTSSEPIYAEFFEDETAKLTAILTGDHKIQTSQPTIIKGKEVIVDGKTEIYDDYQKIGEIEFGKGYEASKKIFTQGNYYTYDGTETTAEGIYYNQVIEELTAGTLCMVVVNERGNTMFLKLAENNEGHYTDGGNTSLATVSSGNVQWADGLQKIQLDSSLDDYCEIAFYKKIISSGERNETTSDEETTGSEQKVRNWYCIYIKKPLSYISPTEDTYENSKASADRINLALQAMGITNLRSPVSFDNTTSDGNTASLAAFSILESSKTESGQAIYRDLKEFLIELGYYTKAEFEYLETNVLTWFIPDYIPADPEHWQQNTDEDVLEYGAIILPKTVEDETEENTEDENTGDGSTEVEENDLEVDDLDTDTKEDTESTTTVTRTSKTGFEPGLNVVAPGNCRIIEYKDNSTDTSENYITLRFDATSQPEISMLHNYTMIIKGIDISDTIGAPVLEDDNEQDSENNDATIDGTNIDTLIKEGTVIEAESLIGFTSNTKIQIILKNRNGAILSNVEDYMSPKLKISTGAAYSGTLSEQLYYILAVEMEGLEDTSEDYYLGIGGGDNAAGYVTVGPGLLMDPEKVESYKNKGGRYTEGMNKQLGSKWDKEAILAIYIEYVDTNFLAAVEQKLDGYKVSQTQMEALVCAAYQLGTGSSSLNTRIDLIKAGASADDLYSNWVRPWRDNYGSDNPYPGVYARRYAEWYLYKYGKYIDIYSNKVTGAADKEIQFTSDTPYRDFIGGN